MRKYITSTYRISLNIARRRRRGKKNAATGIVFVAIIVVASFILGSLNTPKTAKAQESTETTIKITPDLPPAVAVATSTPPIAPSDTPRTIPEAPRGSDVPTQAQKDATAAVCLRVGANRATFLEEHNVSPSSFASTCYYDVLAMAKKESRFNCAAIGDQGRSRGCFQIQTKLHNVSVADAENYEWAAEWTIDRMVRDTGYPYLRTASITRHNGSGPDADQYARDVKAIAEQLRKAGL